MRPFKELVRTVLVKYMYISMSSYLKLKSANLFSDDCWTYHLVKRLETSFFLLVWVLMKKSHSTGILSFSVTASIKPLTRWYSVSCSVFTNVVAFKDGKGKRWRLRSCSPRKEAKLRLSPNERVSLLQREENKVKILCSTTLLAYYKGKRLKAPVSTFNQ